ncbi:hypothetical protein GQ53DRAFT_744483 [Thozetella sp. PMI_491]|nr:hypothetical protein GQ53DRAFT_744483 [Thozetella sp. PMI_491]
MADDDSSDLSSLSSLSAPPSEDESDIQLEKRHGILKFFHKKVDRNPELEPKEMSPPRAKREPSPPHEYVLADNTDIAFIVMFRARFTDILPKSLANFGPQELERDIVDSVPGDRVEHFLCAVLSVLLNRKQDVKPGHYNRALEEAISSHKSQWPRDWEGQNPVSGSSTFATLAPTQRLTLLRTLVLWALSSSDAIKSLIAQQYKNRQDDDLNIGLSVQPWGSDGDKRRYFLVEGNDDTAFRVYRESNPAGVQRTWWSVAGTIDELRVLAEKLETQDGGPKARTLAKKIHNSIPRFEATEEKRRRREYRQMRKEQFKRPEAGFSMYEGRTRGKRMKYTYSDDEDFFTDSTNRRSTRNTRNHTPAELSGPVVTASGRQIRAPTRLNAETRSNGATSAAPSVAGDALNDDVDMEDETSAGPTGRPRRSAAVHHSTNGWAHKKRKSDEYESEDEDSEPDFGDDEEDEHVPEESDEEDDEFADDEIMDEELEDAKPSLVVKLPIKAAIDVDGKAISVSGSLSPADKHKHPRGAHRNVVVSEESSSADSDAQPYPEPEEQPVADEISVAVKPRTRVTPESAQPVQIVGTGTPVPLTPSSGPSTSLAFRGSPEKPQHVPRPIDVGYGE